MKHNSCKSKFRKWKSTVFLPAGGNDNDDANSLNIIFTIKGIKLYVSVITLSPKDN